MRMRSAATTTLRQETNVRNNCELFICSRLKIYENQRRVRNATQQDMQ